MKCILIVVLSIFLNHSVLAIVGYNKSALPLDHPVNTNTVAFIKKNNDKFRVFCSGSIISKKLIATAKHCVEGLENEEIFVYFGPDTHNIDESLIRSVNTKNLYEDKVDLNMSFPSFDFAVVSLINEIPQSLDGPTGKSKFTSLPILSGSHLLDLVDEFVIAGYGIRETRPKALFGTKQWVNTKLNTYVSNNQFVSLALLKGEPNTGTCYGDSGGPLYAKYNNKWYIVGVASGFEVGLTPGSFKVIDVKDNEITPNCHGGESAYVYVGDYLKWVNSITQDNIAFYGLFPDSLPGKKFNPNFDKKSFTAWCENTTIDHKAWPTIRQLLYIASEENKVYSSSEVLSNCSIAEKALNTLKSISFTKDNDSESYFDDLSPIATLENLENLSFVNTKIPNLEPLVNSHLKSLKLHELKIEKISDVRGLLNMTGIKSLSLYHNNIKNIDELAAFTQLEYLSVGSNDITDISPLEGLLGLTVLEFYGNNVKDISPILNLEKLEELLAGGNQLMSPTAPANWPELTFAVFRGNNFDNFDFLENSKKLKRLKK